MPVAAVPAEGVRGAAPASAPSRGCCVFDPCVGPGGRVARLSGRVARGRGTAAAGGQRFRRDSLGGMTFARASCVWAFRNARPARRPPGEGKGAAGLRPGRGAGAFVRGARGGSASRREAPIVLRGVIWLSRAAVGPLLSSAGWIGREIRACWRGGEVIRVYGRAGVVFVRKRLFFARAVLKFRNRALFYPAGRWGWFSRRFVRVGSWIGVMGGGAWGFLEMFLWDVPIVKIYAGGFPFFVRFLCGSYCNSLASVSSSRTA